MYDDPQEKKSTRELDRRWEKAIRKDIHYETNVLQTLGIMVGWKAFVFPKLGEIREEIRFHVSVSTEWNQINGNNK